jgi:hypothetical protein
VLLHQSAKPRFAGQYEMMDLAASLRQTALGRGDPAAESFDHVLWSVSEASKSDRAHALGKVRLHAKVTPLGAGKDVLSPAWRERWLTPEDVTYVLLQRGTDALSGAPRFVLVEWVGGAVDPALPENLGLDDLTNEVEKALGKVLPISFSLQASDPEHMTPEAVDAAQQEHEAAAAAGVASPEQ